MKHAHWPLRPGPNAGTINPRTKQIRPQHCINEAERKLGRFFLVECDWDFDRIAKWLGKPESDVRLALMTVRLPHSDPKRKTLNVSVSAYEHIVGAGLPGEPAWQVMNRLLGI